MSKLLLSLSLVLLSACSRLPENTSQPSYALEKSSNTQLDQEIIFANQRVGLADDVMTMLLLDDGVDAFVARLSLINGAQYSIDVQYYLYHSDLSGHLLTIALWNAAERGVRVRLLLDDMDMDGKDKELSALSSHPNINIRLFNPFIRGKNRTTQLISQFGSITRRMHNKSLTVDATITIVGGRNIGDVYFGADKNTVFGDLDVALTGKVVKQVSDSFDEYWNSPLSYSVELLSDYHWDEETVGKISKIIDNKSKNIRDTAYIKELQDNNLIELIQNNDVKIYTGEAQVLVDHPSKIVTSRDKTEHHLAPQLVPYLKNAQKELIIVSPYFVPGMEGMAFFSELINKGIEIKILTNSLKSNDVMVVHAGYSKYRKKLLEMGVKLYEVDSKLLTSESLYNKSSHKKRSIWGKSKASLHAKYFIIDRKYTFIGSLNLDPRSINENTEIGVILTTRQLSQDIAAEFDRSIQDIAFKLSLKEGSIIWEKSEADNTILHNNEPYSSWWERVVVGFISLLPGESQL